MTDGDWFKGGSSAGAVDVHGLITAHTMKGLLDMVEAGALVSLGTTSDGGALAITVTVDGEWRREYVRHEEELLLLLAAAVPAVEALCADRRPSPAPRAASRRSRPR